MGPLWPEWTLANGLGGFAMGTALGVNTRRYHGLLVAAIKPPVERAVVLSQVADVLRLGPERGETFAKGEAPIELRCTMFHFLASPSAAINNPSLESFEHDAATGEVCWTYRFATPAGEVRVVKTLRLTDGANACTLRYDIESPRAWSLELCPMVGLRDAHQLGSDDAAESRVMHREMTTSEGRPGVLVTSRGLGAYLTTDHGRYEAHAQRWRGVEYLWERRRGLDSNESLFSPGRFVASGARGGSVTLFASVHAELEAPAVHDSRPTRIASLVDHVQAACPDAEPEDRTRLARLAAASDLFVVQRGNGNGGGAGCSVIAGYPWFTDWGRDTMISMPGLLLGTGRFEEAGRTLTTFARARRRGLIPNHFDDRGGAAHFNTVDASLWFIHACGEYLESSGDRERFAQDLLPACEEIVAAYAHGTDYAIGTDPDDGLIVAGDVHTQLTWMDARRDGVTFTPRFGKPVEINALWHHALLTLASMVPSEHEADELRARATRVAASFKALFAGGPGDGLFDRAEPSHEGWAMPNELRPNQIFAASLAHSPLSPELKSGVVEAVGEHLLTDAGLRTLAHGDAHYRPRFEGDLFERDAAYHNGTVWPWLIGHYAEAVLRAGEFSPESRETARAALRPVIDRLGTDSVGSIPEIYDADAPRRPDGCMAQAWSVAEPLRALMLTYS
ncbi:MAG: putative glycogen debranching enzyme [Phycisphaerales bacterium]